ncbi:MAG: 4Fe-4S dicluster domain-containing protein [Euryarchaeota archaeon]|nr:4Fe-4S dicluster domain-containing protein [Euryarchaeota archaeon]
MKPGAVISEPGSTVRNRTGGWRVFRPVFDMKECIDCGNCWIFCPESCVSRSEEGEYSADLDYCKGCGICANECPTEAIKMELEEK